MEELKVGLENKEATDGHYRAWFRCTNCGTIFEYEMPKGTQAKNMGGACPNCNVVSNKQGAGVFPIVKYNPEYDQVPTYYAGR